MKEEHIFINCYNSKLNLCFSLKKLVSNYSLDILCVLEFATNRNAPKPSAGVPLTYYHKNLASTSVNNLTVKFLETPFTGNDDYTYRKNGFSPYITLNEIFKNAYTQISGDELQIRAMKAEDIYTITKLTEMTYGWAMNLGDTKYKKLFANGAWYNLASAYGGSLWSVFGNGRVDFFTGHEARNPTNNFTAPYN